MTAKAVTNSDQWLKNNILMRMAAWRRGMGVTGTMLGRTPEWPRAYLEPNAIRARLRGQELIWSQTRKGQGFEAEGLPGAKREKGQTGARRETSQASSPRAYLEPGEKKTRLRNPGLIWSQTRKGPGFEVIWSQTRQGPGFEAEGLSGARREKGQALRPRPYLEPDAKRARLRGCELIRSQTPKGPGFEAQDLSAARCEKGLASRPRPYLEPDTKRARLRGRGLIWSQTQKGPGFEAESLSGARRGKGQSSRPRVYLEPKARRARLRGRELIWSQTRKGDGLPGARAARARATTDALARARGSLIKTIPDTQGSGKKRRPSRLQYACTSSVHLCAHARISLLWTVFLSIHLLSIHIPVIHCSVHNRTYALALLSDGMAYVNEHHACTYSR